MDNNNNNASPASSSSVPPVLEDIDIPMEESSSVETSPASQLVYSITNQQPAQIAQVSAHDSAHPTIASSGLLTSKYADPKTELGKMISHLQEKLNKLILDYRRTIDTSTTEQQIGLLNEIKHTRTTLREFRELFQQDYSHATSVTATNTTPISRLSYRDIPSFQLAGSNIWKPGKDVFDSVEHFLGTFTKVLKAHDADLDKQWEKWLALAVHHDHDTWFETHLANKGLTWQEAQKVFRKRFESIDRRLAMATEAYNMVMLPTESVLDFGVRFQKAVREGGLIDHEGLAFRLLASLLPHIRENVQVAWHGRYGKELPKSYEDVLEVAQAVSVNKRGRHDGQEDQSSRPNNRRRFNPVSHSGLSSSSSASRASRHSPVGCAYHGPQAHHSTAECKRKSERPPRDVHAKRQNNCTYCDKQYFPGHRCQEYRDAKAKQHTAPTTNSKPRTGESFRLNALTAIPTAHPGEEAIGDLTETMDELNFTSSGKAHKSAPTKQTLNSIFTPILIQGERLSGLLDTGGEISAINASLCNKNNWTIVPRSGDIHFAGRGHLVKRVGTTQPLNIHYNGRNIIHTFEIMELQDDTEVILGLDIMPKLGIALTGVATNWDDNAQVASTEEDQDTPEPNNSPAGTAQQQSLFKNAIQPFLDANLSIPKDSFCTVPESIVHLPTSQGSTTYQRQYPIPFKLRPLIDEAIQNWLMEGTITRAPVNTSWNSPLTLADKKDSYGKKTGKRPCLDPRHINRLLPDDRYPLPLIRDIYDSLRGSNIFTTLDLKSAFHRFQIYEADRHKTTFTHNGVQYMFQGCPFGLKPLSAKFQRVMAIIFHDLPFIQTFVDDIIVSSKSMDEHITHVQTAIQKLTEVNLILNPHKCHFAQQSVYLLGFCVSRTGIRLDERKLTNIQDWPIPTTGQQVQSFLGLVNYWSK